jgi:hypothetical protein
LRRTGTGSASSRRAYDDDNNDINDSNPYAHTSSSGSELKKLGARTSSGSSGGAPKTGSGQSVAGSTMSSASTKSRRTGGGGISMSAAATPARTIVTPAVAAGRLAGGWK